MRGRSRFTPTADRSTRTTGQRLAHARAHPARDPLQPRDRWRSQSTPLHVRWSRDFGTGSRESLAIRPLQKERRGGNFYIATTLNQNSKRSHSETDEFYKNIFGCLLRAYCCPVRGFSVACSDPTRKHHGHEFTELQQGHNRSVQGALDKVHTGRNRCNQRNFLPERDQRTGDDHARPSQLVGDHEQPFWHSGGLCSTQRVQLFPGQMGSSELQASMRPARPLLRLQDGPLQLRQAAVCTFAHYLQSGLPQRRHSRKGMPRNFRRVLLGSPRGRLEFPQGLGKE